MALVDARDLAIVMQYMVSSGRGLAMLRGITETELREIDGALWDELSDNPAAARRDRWCASAASSRCSAPAACSDLLMHTGYRLIAPAVQVAARMRLNANLGFNPVKFERSLVELLGKRDFELALAA